MRINSVAELKSLRDSLKESMRLRNLGEAIRDIVDVCFLVGDSPKADEARQLMSELCSWVVEKGRDDIRIRAVDMMETDRGPAMKVVDVGGRTSVYIDMDGDKLKAVAEKHLMQGEIVREFLDR